MRPQSFWCNRRGCLRNLSLHWSLGGVENRINTIAQEIQSRENLEKIVHQFNLLASPDGQKPLLEGAIASIRSRIEVSITSKRQRGGANAFSITYNDTDPDRTSDIANALASQFINENLKIREAQALGTSDFLEEELSAMQFRLRETEKELSDYRRKHMGELPSQLESNLRQLDRLQRELADKEEALGGAKARFMVLSNQSSLYAVEDESKSNSYDGMNNLSYSQLQAELTRLRAHYTDKHPDIIRLKSLLEGSSLNSGDGQKPSEPQVVIDTRNDIRNYERDIAKIRRQIETIGYRVDNIPRREQELLSIERDYNNLRESYQSLLDRKLEAEIAVNMERKQKGEQFRVLDPAYPPSRPMSPDTSILFAIALISGLGVAAGICFLIESSSRILRKPDEIENALGLPLVATIPILPRRKMTFIKHFNTVMTVAASGVVCVVYGLFGALIFLGENGLITIVNNYWATIN